MGKKRKKKKNKVAKVTPQHQRKTRFVFRKDRTLCRIELECGVTLHLRKARSSRLQDMINATPTFQRTIEFTTKIYRAAAEKVDLNTIDAPDEMTIPGHEIAQLHSFFADNTTAIDGVDDVDGEPIYWQTLSADEQLEFYETLPPVDIFEVYGQYMAYLASDADPVMRAGI